MTTLFKDTRVSFYTQNKVTYRQDVPEHYPAYPVSSSSNSVGWQNWESKTSENFLNIKNLFHTAQIIGIESRGNGGRAYKVLVDLELDNRETEKMLVDLREGTVLEIMKTTGIREGAIIEGNFKFESGNLVIARENYVQNFEQSDEKVFEKIRKSANKLKNEIPKALLTNGVYTQVSKDAISDNYYIVLDELSNQTKNSRLVIECPKNEFELTEESIFGYLESLDVDTLVSMSCFHLKFRQKMYEKVLDFESEYRSVLNITKTLMENVTERLTQLIESRNPDIEYVSADLFASYYTLMLLLENFGEYSRVGTNIRVFCRELSKQFRNDYTQNQHPFYNYTDNPILLWHFSRINGLE